MIIGVNNSPLALVPFSKSTLANKREIGTQKKGYVGVSENGVPLNPMVNDHYPY